MGTMSLPFEHQRAEGIRLSKKSRIKSFFANHMEERFSTEELHKMFGTAFRSRVSEINREPECLFIIRNQSWVSGGREHSEYWAEEK